MTILTSNVKAIDESSSGKHTFLQILTAKEKKLIFYC